MSAIRSFGHYLPATVLTNAELADRLGVAPEWIRQTSGIEERRVAGTDESVAAMGAKAAESCLSHGEFSASSLGLILVASGTGPQRFPGPAASIADLLGLNSTPAIDLPLASAGSLFGMALASDLAARFGPVLVVASERMTGPGLSEPLTKEVAPLFGDGAGACLILPGEQGLAILGHELRSDGAFSQALALGFDGRLNMDGRTVILQASRKIPTAMADLLARHSIPAQTVAAFLMHQANQNLIDRVAKAMGVDSGRFFSNIARYGNTSSASMLIAASEYFETRRPKSGEYFCFAAFGAGFHWGSVLAVAS